MKINRYLAILNIVFLLAFFMSMMRIEIQSRAKEKMFETAYKNLKTGGKLDYLKVMEMRSADGKAKIFFVETLGTGAEKSGEPAEYQVGRLVSMVQDNRNGDWFPIAGENKVFWDDRNLKGNKFTFPPFTGRDKLILLKK